MKTTCLLGVVFFAAGCAHAPNAHYMALDAKRTNPDHLRQAESLRIPSVSFTQATLESAAAAFFVCDENPSRFQNTILLADGEPGWAKQPLTLTLEDVSFARLCDELCIQTGSVWWADTVIHIEKKK